MDLFKAIFDNSESDSSSESDGDEETKPSTMNSVIPSTFQFTNPVLVPHSDAEFTRSASPIKMLEQNSLLPTVVAVQAESSANCSESGKFQHFSFVVMFFVNLMLFE